MSAVITRWAVMVLALFYLSPVGADELEPFARFAQQLTADYNQGRSELFDRSFDADTFMGRIAKALPEDSASREAALSGVRQGVERLGKQLLQHTGDGVRWDFLRIIKEQGGQAQALIRVDMGGQGLLYLRFQLRQDGEAVSIEDWYGYSSAQYATQIIANTLRLYSVAQQPIDRVVLRRFLRARNAGDNATAREHYSELSPAMRRDPNLLVLLLEVSGDDEPAHRQALADLAAAVGDDARYAFVLIDHHIYERNYHAAIRAVDSFASRVGDDGALQGLRGNLHRLGGEPRRALAHYRQALQLEPDYEEAYTSLLDVLVDEQLYPEAVTVLRILTGRFGYALTPQYMAGIEGYEEFRASAHYQTWLDEK